MELGLHRVLGAQQLNNHGTHRDAAVRIDVAIAQLSVNSIHTWARLISPKTDASSQQRSVSSCALHVGADRAPTVR